MIGWYLIFFLITTILGYSNVFGDDNRHFYILTTWLCIFLLIEIKLLYDKKWPYFIINPIILSCIVTFGISLGGITNFLQLKDGSFYFLEVGGKVLPYEPGWLKVAMAQVCYAALFMWLGYKGNLGVKLSRLILYKFQMKRFLSTDLAIGRLMLLTAFAYAAKFYLFSIGLYGRILDSKYFSSVTGYKAGSQIRVLGDLSTITFIFICYLYFAKKNKKYTFLFFTCLLLELFFAFLYGARGPFIIPFLIIFVTSYYTTKRVSAINFLFLPVAIYLAFTIVLEFKNYTLSSSFKRDPSPIGTISNFIKYRETVPQALYLDIYENTSENVKASTNAIANAAMAIRHSDTYGLDENDPNFLGSTISSPYNAIVPKFLQSKNEFPWGYWFKNKVLHHNTHLKYSVSITPIGFLYFTGGIIGVCIGFFIYGIFLRFSFIYINYGIIGFLMFMVLTSVLYNFDSIFSSTLVNMIRYTFIYPIIFYFLFSRFRQ